MPSIIILGNVWQILGRGAFPPIHEQPRKDPSSIRLKDNQKLANFFTSNYLVLWWTLIQNLYGFIDSNLLLGKLIKTFCINKCLWNTTYPRTQRWLFLMDFKVTATSPINVDTLKKIIFQVPKEIQKLSERKCSGSETIDHLEIYTMRNSHST